MGFSRVSEIFSVAFRALSLLWGNTLCSEKSGANSSSFQISAMVGYILVYPKNITSIDAESGASCDTTALRSPLSGGALTASYQCHPAIWCARRGPPPCRRTFCLLLVWAAQIGRPRFPRWMRLRFSLDHCPRWMCGRIALLRLTVRRISYVPRTPEKSIVLQTGPFSHLHFIINMCTSLVCHKSMPSKFHLPGAKRNT